MRKFLALIMLTAALIMGGSVSAHALRIAYPGPDQCSNVKGHQGVDVFIYRNYRRIGNPDRNLCAPVNRYQNSGR